MAVITKSRNKNECYAKSYLAETNLLNLTIEILQTHLF